MLKYVVSIIHINKQIQGLESVLFFKLILLVEKYFLHTVTKYSHTVTTTFKT